MLKNIKKILFATDLSQECQDAYDTAVGLAMSCQVGITLIHVIESPAESIEDQLRNLLGEERYGQIMAEHEKSTRSILIGKRKESDIIQSALFQFCEDRKDNHPGCYLQPDEIVIKHGDIVKEILSAAVEREMDLIVLSAHKTILTGASSVSRIPKSILRLSKVPVLIVPPRE
jgi:nucleotide-binding universal stress UspA family protein